MSRAEAWLLHASNVAVGGTGLVYAWMRYLARPADEFAVVGHPWQPQVQHLHVLVAPALVFATGLVWRDHVWGRVRSGFRARRRSGLVLCGLFAPMALSGYLLQVAVDERWRGVWVVLHVASSLVWIGVYLAHQLSRRALRSAAAGAPRSLNAPRASARAARAARAPLPVAGPPPGA